MTQPLQIALPDNAQVNIYLGGAPAALSGAAEPIDAAIPLPRRRPFRLAVLGALLIGLGYFAHGLVAGDAAAEAERATASQLRVMPLPPPLASASPSEGGLTSPNIRVTPPRPFGSPGAAIPPAALSGSPPPSISNAAPPGAPPAIARSPFGLN
jgi:hypothetical protein